MVDSKPAGSALKYSMFADPAGRSGNNEKGIFTVAKGVAIWWPETEKFMREIGLPTAVTLAIETTLRPPKTDFAALGDVSKVPYLNDRRRELYQKFLSLPYPRAFSIAQTGHGLCRVNERRPDIVYDERLFMVGFIRCCR
jgi:hypothetical protein